MLKRMAWSVLALALTLATPTLAEFPVGPQQVADLLPWSASSPAIEVDGKSEQRVWSETILLPDAADVAPHFAHFDLPTGARVVVTAPDGSRSWEYRGAGNGGLGRTEGFWGIHIPGEIAIVELWSSVSVAAGAVRIDQVARGFGPEVPPTEDTEALCGADDSQWAPCYQTSEPAAYSKARAVARLRINGSGACTGWLVGNAGHVMTNEHCIGNASDALNTNYEFMAEGATCGTNCASWFGCPGTVVATSATLIQLDAGLDYALVQLPTNPAATYGYLQLRDRGTHAGERIYIPQHPQGWGKRIAVSSTHTDDETGFCEVQSTTRPSCSGGPIDDIGYYCDTQAGSSGSPVLARCDNLVVALHHCANCPNRGVPIDAIIRDLGANLPPNAVGASWGCGDCSDGYCVDNQFCDTDGCYPEDSPISKAVCQCGLIDPTCGFGGCYGDAYCEAADCPFPVCYAPGTPWSLVMCEGWDLDAFCEPTP